MTSVLTCARLALKLRYIRLVVERDRVGIVQDSGEQTMKQHGAKKAKESEFGVNWAIQKERRAARFDPNWRASELADSDIWQRRNAEFDRAARP